MKNRNGNLDRVAGGVAVLAALGAFAVLVGSGCEATTEGIDNYDSRVACSHYCAKKFDCQNNDPSSEQTDTCVNACRNSIEDNCGNEHQAAANDKIEQCVDMGCGDFWACMVFDAAPDCYGFVGS